MHNFVLSPIDPKKLSKDIADQVTANILLAVQKNPQPTTAPDPLDDLVPKSEVRGKLASSSTLWKYEKDGKIQVYAIGGKRFYKRSELMQALIKLKK
ncbi:hypothetical protein N8273_00370 [Algibacter sp.]|jgi:hypothetical protein|nr:hypothetical protein [Algibacter sp.]